MNIILRNNTGNKQKEELINGFVIRTKQFKLLFKEISESYSSKPEQNYLIIGQRGTGKTTLLYRLKYAIEDKLTNEKGIIPIMFSEEQYHLSELSNLWESIADYLEDGGYFSNLRFLMEKEYGSKYYEEKAFDVLEKSLKTNEKKLIVFIENIDNFLKKITLPGQKRLREILTTSKHLRLIGSSTTYFDAILNYSYPFYNFFKVFELRGLTKEETFNLLIKIGEEDNKSKEIEWIIQKNSKRIESLRRLTGGIPRTISYLFQILIDNENGKAIKDLYQLIDTLTFLYKAELDQLSPLQQKIIDVIAKNWDAIGVKEIVLKTRIESKQVSAILQVLERNQLIESITTKTKNNLYRIRERFLNIWYLMRFGRKHEKENVIWLVRFFESWCNKSELSKHILNHIENLVEGNYDFNSAVYMGNTFLACDNVSGDLKYNLYKTTKSFLPRKFIKDLIFSDKELYDSVNKLLKFKKNQEAIELLEAFSIKDEKYFNFASWVYLRGRDYTKAAAMAENFYYLDTKNPIGALRVGYLNDFYLNNLDKAKAFYQIALDKNDFKAAYFIGMIYEKENNINEAKKYYLLGSEKNIIETFPRLMRIFFKEKKYQKSELYFNKSIDSKLPTAIIQYGNLFQENRNFKKAKSLYERALELGNDEALLYLGELNKCMPKPDFQVAKQYFEEAVTKKIKGSGYLLGSLLLEHLKDEKLGLELLIKESMRGDSDAAHKLGHHFNNKKQFSKSDKYFLQSIKYGRLTSLFCLSTSIFVNGRKDKKEFILQQFEQTFHNIENEGALEKLEYGFVLLWNNRTEQALEIIESEANNIKKVFDSENETKINFILDALSSIIMLLIAKQQFNLAFDFFENKKRINYKQVLKPLYYALMNYMKDEHPKEYLKAGEELQETIKELIMDIEEFKLRI